MQIKEFIGNYPSKSIKLYNEWAKGKPLTRDVIVHSHIVKSPAEGNQTILILVFFDEYLHKNWLDTDDTQV